MDSFLKVILVLFLPNTEALAHAAPNSLRGAEPISEVNREATVRVDLQI